MLRWLMIKYSINSPKAPILNIIQRQLLRHDGGIPSFVIIVHHVASSGSPRRFDHLITRSVLVL